MQEVEASSSTLYDRSWMPVSVSSITCRIKWKAALPVTLTGFFRNWLNGDIAFGTWDEHVLSYVTAFASGSDKMEKLDDGREFLLLTNEDLIEDLPSAVNLVINFLELDIASEQVRDLLPTFSFANMKADINRFQPNFPF